MELGDKRGSHLERGEKIGCSGCLTHDSAVIPFRPRIMFTCSSMRLLWHATAARANNRRGRDSHHMKPEYIKDALL